MANRLAQESSPYLLQHAENPVDWYPWGAEALDRARSEARPILLSVGYSSCHWCHVMERESFEDPGVAALMNRHFVNVKVDREERPDIDQIYMRAVQAMTGRGGWPMTVFLTPEGIPFFGGTYYPPEPRPGLPSFPQVLAAVHDAWTHRRDEVEAGGARLLDALRKVSDGGAEAGVRWELVENTARRLARDYDPRHGGFGRAPKFPQAVTLELLFRHHLRSGEASSLEMAIHTLRCMAAGGIRDHLAGGFHRYSVDERWLVPHFEKMLYDNALLASAYLDGWRLTGDRELADVACETLDWMLRDMRGPDGGFYAAWDADSEGEEGRFYVWSAEEIEEVLGADLGRLFSRAYGVTDQGNFEGANILHLPRDLAATAREEGVDADELERRLAAARQTLLARREEREAPFRDEKVLVAWNGLAIRALAEAGAALGRPDYIRAASDAADFLWTRLRSDGVLLHSWIDGDARIPGFLDDHAALGNALLSLHGATLDPRWLDAALGLGEEILGRFRDSSTGTLYDTAEDAETLVVRPRDPMDGATPSGPSLAAEFLARAGHLTGRKEWSDAARATVESEGDALERFGAAFGRMLSVVDRLEAEPVEIVILGGDGQATSALIQAAHADLLPGGVITGVPGGREPPSSPDLPLLEGRRRLDGRATAYVCRGYACRLPVTEPDAVLHELRGSSPS